jgi:molybdopterin biosynthesis enzyme
MSNFFLPKKDKINNIQRQQSVQKAMKYLRNKPKALKRLNTTIPITKNKNQLLARSILASSKIPRIRRKPGNQTDDSSSK